MFVKITRNTLIDAVPYGVGDEIEVEKRIGVFLVNIGKAVKIDEIQKSKSPIKKEKVKLNDKSA